MSKDMMQNVPAHVSLIMDGNGRWAKERGKERVYGHFEGVESVRACMKAAVEFGVRYLSVFAFSEENWNRPQEEVETLMGLMVKSMENELGSMNENGVRFLVLGNRARLSDSLNEQIDNCQEQTKHNKRLTFIVFLSYSGKWDIFQAALRIAEDIKNSPESGPESLAISDFDKYLVTAGIPDPDLIVRTSGENRLSNYLLWQAAYSEFYFTDVLWPDFRREQFKEALEEYSRRDRRFGKVK